MKKLFTLFFAVLITAGAFPQIQYGTLIDVDSNTYKTVKIGSQVWMAANLRVTHYKNGDPIPNVIEYDTGDPNWRFTTAGAWCDYNNDSTLGKIYGHLYNYYAAVDPKGIAPEGWHVATQDDWDALFLFLGSIETAGRDLKEAGTEYWATTSPQVTNPYGWSGRGGGMRSSTFSVLKNYHYFWRLPMVPIDPIVNDVPYPIQVGITLDNYMTFENCDQPWQGNGIRCVKDDTIFEVTGIKELNTNLSCSVYPNPTAGSLKLRIENYDIRNLKYHIYDINGTLFQSKKVTNNETIISMEKFVPGVYFMKVTDGNREVKTHKIIKN